MVQFKPPKALFSEESPERLPTEHDLPDTDGRPVDNELQLLIPILLRGVLEMAWALGGQGGKKAICRPESGYIFMMRVAISIQPKIWSLLTE